MNLSTYSTANLAAAFNAITGAGIKKFENRQKAEQRLIAALAERGLDESAVESSLAGNRPAPSLSDMAAAVEAGEAIKEAPKMKKPHEADIAAQSVIANADRYNVHLRLGPASKINQPASTLDEARTIADQLKVEHGKQAMIYAISASGASALVTPAMLKSPAKVDMNLAAATPPDAERAARFNKVKPRDKAPERSPGTRTRRATDATISAVVENPKKPGSRAHARFALYKAGQTVSEFIAACAAAGFPEVEAKADISWDSRKGFIKVS